MVEGKKNRRLKGAIITKTKRGKGGKEAMERGGGAGFEDHEKKTGDRSKSLPIAGENVAQKSGLEEDMKPQCSR